MLSVINQPLMLSVVILNVIMLNVVAPLERSCDPCVIYRSLFLEQ
jgi:hypothetical protein